MVLLLLQAISSATSGTAPSSWLFSLTWAAAERQRSGSEVVPLAVYRSDATRLPTPLELYNQFMFSLADRNTATSWLLIVLTSLKKSLVFPNFYNGFLITGY